MRNLRQTPGLYETSASPPPSLDDALCNVHTAYALSLKAKHSSHLHRKVNMHHWDHLHRTMNVYQILSLHPTLS